MKIFRNFGVRRQSRRSESGGFAAALRKVARLDRSERWLLAEALFVVPAVRVVLTILPFRIARRVIERARSKAAASRRTPCRPEQVARMVAAVGRRVPGASCLTQAFAASLLLARHGHDATLRFGVAKNADGTIRAHAWVESGGQTLLGGPELETFARL